MTRDPFRTELAALYPGLRRFARSLCGSRAEADDLLQNSMVMALRYEKSFVPGTNMNAWACTIIRHQAINAARRRKSGPAVIWIDEPGLDLPIVAGGDGMIDLRACIVRLNPVMQAVACHLALGSTINEMVEAMGCAVGTVQSRTSRTRAALMAEMGRGEFAERVAA